MNLSTHKLRIHKFIPNTKVAGPGNRACVWVQGCPIHCLGCAVPWTWSNIGGQEIDIAELLERIFHGPEIEGVTFVGGEPFAQSGPLATIGKIVQDAGLSVVTFTGYTLEEIMNSERKAYHDLLSITDLLIDGPFRKDLSDLSRPWVGSSNQRYHFLTSRYKYLETELNNIPNRLEVRLYPDGQIFINGMASSDILAEMFESYFTRTNVTS